MADTMLDGVKVLDLSQLIAGPYCAKLLADYGAEVIKVEPPEGEPSRRLSPFAQNDPNIEKSGVFMALNTNKKSITLNLNTTSGQNILRRLAREADILVESFNPDTMEGWGLGYEELEQVNPRLVMISITPFGQTGPFKNYRGSEMTVYAMSGVMWVTGGPDDNPLKMADYASSGLSGASACIATLAAYFGVQFNGLPGQHIDFSLQESQASSIDRGGTNLLAAAYSGSLYFYRALALSTSLMPVGNYPCQDGFIHMSPNPAWWDRFCRMLDRPDMTNDPNFTQNLFNLEKIPEIEAILIPWVYEHGKQWIMEKAQAEGFAITAVNTMEDTFKDPHLKSRDFFTEMDHPEAGKVVYPGPPFRPELAPRLVGKAPLLGEHNVEVYEGLGYTKQDMVILRERGVI